MVHLKLVDSKNHFLYYRVFLGFFVNVGIFHYWQDLLARLNLVGWKTHFSILQGLLGQIYGFLINAGIFHYGLGFSVHLNLVGWKTHFSILRVLL